jgi:replication factor A1
MENNYQQLVQFISEASGVGVDEIEKKIEAKQAKLAGLISKEGAAQVIAAELNVNFDKQIVKISHLVPGMRKINLVGKIIELFPVREYNKNGRSGKIGSFILADETSNVRTVLWDENHIDLIEKGQILKDGCVEIGNASIRNGEIHLGSFSEIKVVDKVIDNVVLDKPVITKEIVSFNPSDNVAARAFIVNMFEPKFFEVCPECRKKVSESGECNEHGKVIPDKRALLSLVLDDGSENIRATIFSEVLDKIFTKEELESSELFALKKKDYLGKEFIVKGQVRRNQMFDSNDFIVEGFEEINLDNLIEELEK